jgi:hypothetical protein
MPTKPKARVPKRTRNLQPMRRRRTVLRRSARSKARNGEELAAFKKKVERAFESIEDRLDYLESEASLTDGKPIPAEQVWKQLGL